MQRLFSTTNREAPVGAQLKSHRLLLQAGYVRQVSGGIFAFLPLGTRSIRRIEEIIRQEMDNLGGQECLLPVASPASLWKNSGRYGTIGPELLRFEDRNGKEMVLNMTHEEVSTTLVSPFLRSHKQLPFMLYQINTKYRDEARPRGGLIRLREFVMKDGYSFHADEEDLDRYYPQVQGAYKKIFERCGLPTLTVASDPGDMGGSVAHEYMALTPLGEDTVVVCSSCSYAANRDVATTKRDPAPDQSSWQNLDKAETPECGTVAEVASFLKVPIQKVAKTLLLGDSQRKKLYMVVLRGDLDLDVGRLEKLTGTPCQQISPEEIAQKELVVGYLSPVGIEPKEKGIEVFVDRSVEGVVNMVAGGNQKDIHYVGVNFPRDFSGSLVDVAQVLEGDCCPSCGEALVLKRAIEVGNIFKLGTKYSKALKCLYLNAAGQQQPAVMGCYGLGVARILATLVEIFSDERGIVLPPEIAPFDLHLIPIELHKDAQVRKVTERFISEWESRGHSILVDDRRETPGVKFKDADLMGLPVRVVISPRALAQEKLEVKWRWEEEVEMVALSEVIEHIEQSTPEHRSRLDLKVGQEKALQRGFSLES